MGAVRTSANRSDLTTCSRSCGGSDDEDSTISFIKSCSFFAWMHQLRQQQTPQKIQGNGRRVATDARCWFDAAAGSRRRNVSALAFATSINQKYVKVFLIGSSLRGSPPDVSAVIYPRTPHRQGHWPLRLLRSFCPSCPVFANRMMNVYSLARLASGRRLKGLWSTVIAWLPGDDGQLRGRRGSDGARCVLP